MIRKIFVRMTDFEINNNQPNRQAVGVIKVIETATVIKVIKVISAGCEAPR